MAHDTTAPPALAFSGATFARLAPGPYLQAHLKQPNSTRPSGRQPTDFRQPSINAGSLSHCNGSAVVRLGDTAVVCGVRGEILLASNIPNPPNPDHDDEHLIEHLGLVVPNLELSTGCSPAHLPGSPPGSLAQSLSYRIHALLRDTDMIHPESLRITYDKPSVDDESLQTTEKVVQAYWTLYIDCMCLALDGNAFDAAWLAVVSALQNTVLPKAWWDADREAILCSPLASESCVLTLSSLPLASTFAVHTTASHTKKRGEAEYWLLADPDSFEEAVCHEAVTVVVDASKTRSGGVVKIEKSGGRFVSTELLAKCIEASQQRWTALQAHLKEK